MLEEELYEPRYIEVKYIRRNTLIENNQHNNKTIIRKERE